MTESQKEWFAALQRGDVPAIERLLAAEPALLGARHDSGVSSVMWTCYTRQAAARAVLLAAGAPLDVFEAVAAGEAPAALNLIERDPALARAWAPDGFTALHLAAFFGRPELVALLLSRGADPGVASRNATNVTPLHSAAAAAATEIARLLLERDVDVNARQAQNFTALMSAAQQGNDALADLLLSHGADAAACCDDGRAAADFADEKGHHALAARLRGAGT